MTDLSSASVSENNMRPPATNPAWAWYWWVIALCALPALVLHGRNLIEQEYASAAVLVLIAMGYVLARECRQPQIASRRRSAIAAIGFLAGVLLLMSAMLLWLPWLAPWAIILLGGSWLFRFAPRVHAMHAITIMLYTGLVALPDRFVAYWTERILDWSSGMLSGLLDRLEWPHLQVGNFLETSERIIDMHELTQGMQSLYVFWAVAGAILILKPRSLISWLMVLILSPWVAVLQSVAKGFVILIAAKYWNTDVIVGSYQVYFQWGWLVAMVLTDGLLVLMVMQFVAPIPPPDNRDSIPLSIEAFNRIALWPIHSAKPGQSSTKNKSHESVKVLQNDDGPWRIVQASSLPMVSVLMVVSVLYCFWLANDTSHPIVTLGSKILDKLPNAANPDLSRWGFGPNTLSTNEHAGLEGLGTRTLTWRATQADQETQLCIDFLLTRPAALHELIALEQWNSLSRSRHQKSEFRWSEIELSGKLDPNHGYLAWTLLDAKTAKSDSFTSKLWKRLRRGPLGIVYPASASHYPRFIQIRMLHQQNAPVTADQVEILRDRLTGCLQQLAPVLEEATQYE